MYINTYVKYFGLFSETCIKWELEERQQLWARVEANPGQWDYGEKGDSFCGRRRREGGNKGVKNKICASKKKKISYFFGKTKCFFDHFFIFSLYFYIWFIHYFIIL